MPSDWPELATLGPVVADLFVRSKIVRSVCGVECWLMAWSQVPRVPECGHWSDTGSMKPRVLHSVLSYRSLGLR